MINSIRAVRRAKGLTLEEVGARCDPPTTAQTIGRLETGTRTLSLGWMNRIAAALGVEAAELVQLPQDTQLTITAHLGADGAQAPTRVEQALTARPAEDMVAVRVSLIRIGSTWAIVHRTTHSILVWVIQGITWACVACVADKVTIRIGLIKIGYLRTVVHIGTQTVMIRIVCRIQWATVTYIACPVAIGVQLVRIRDGRAIVAGITHVVVVRILLTRVGSCNTVVNSIADVVAVIVSSRVVLVRPHIHKRGSTIPCIGNIRVIDETLVAIKIRLNPQGKR